MTQSYHNLMLIKKQQQQQKQTKFNLTQFSESAFHQQRPAACTAGTLGLENILLLLGLCRLMSLIN